jgi:hypothetical protein
VATRPSARLLGVIAGGPRAILLTDGGCPRAHCTLGEGYRVLAAVARRGGVFGPPADTLLTRSLQDGVVLSDGTGIIEGQDGALRFLPGSAEREWDDGHTAVASVGALASAGDTYVQTGSTVSLDELNGGRIVPSGLQGMIGRGPGEPRAVSLSGTLAPLAAAAVLPDRRVVVAGTPSGSVLVAPRGDGAVGVLISGDATTTAGGFFVVGADGTVGPLQPLGDVPVAGDLILHAQGAAFLVSTPGPAGLWTVALPG